MNITLPPEQQKWLKSEVAAGRFHSLDDAIAAAVAELMTIDSDDLAWARPFVEQARASVARGDVVSGDEFFERLQSKLDALRWQWRSSSSPLMPKPTFTKSSTISETRQARPWPRSTAANFAPASTA
jgi:antitoxin ParD1/3/4